MNLTVATVALGVLTLTMIVLAFTVSYFHLYLAPSEQAGYWVAALESLGLLISWPKLALS